MILVALGRLGCDEHCNASAGVSCGEIMHPDPAAVTAPLFNRPLPFFLAADKIQVK